MAEGELIEEHIRDESLDYLIVLKSLRAIPFGVGKNLLIDFLIGDTKNKSIQLNKLSRLSGFGELRKSKREYILDLIENSISNGIIDINESVDNRFMKFLILSNKGQVELANPSLDKKKLKNNFVFKKTIISEEDRRIFSELDVFLNIFYDEQKKSIISRNKHILCVAGAGSGKTMALTKRIEFLVKYKGINKEKILAITFTRKAKQEMISRLKELEVQGVNVETFNSFCEKILKKYGQLIYGRSVSIMNYGNRVLALNGALQNLNIKMDEAVDKYFSIAQKRSKTREQLVNIFLNDCFFILEYFKSKNLDFYDFSIDANINDKESAKMIYNICKYLKEYMFRGGLRDYSDQVLDALKFLKDNKEFVPDFDHILVDEYQDVNSMQIELIEVLNGKNLFCVGDPRQSIFGWRGSDIHYILNFEEKYQGSEIISLTKNYRSSKKIIDFLNESIRIMEIPDLSAGLDKQGNIEIINFVSEAEERKFVVDKILNLEVERSEIFVLARTNKQLNDLSIMMSLNNINHIVKTDEIKKPVDASEGDITLATIHSIKGLEAKVVFVIGCNESNFPCKVSDHPIIGMIKIENYDREEEERRLFYVALSRAKEKLYLTYSGKKITRFVSGKMLEMV